MPHRNFRFVAIATALFMLAAPPALAQTAPAAPQTITDGHLAQARELVATSGIAKSLESVPAGMAETFKRGFSVTRPEVVKDFDAVIVDMKPFFDLMLQDIEVLAVKAVAGKFSEAELKDLNTFFKSPTGAKYVRIFPDVLDEVSASVETWGQPKEREIMEKIRGEMRKRGHNI